MIYGEKKKHECTKSKHHNVCHGTHIFCREPSHPKVSAKTDWCWKCLQRKKQELLVFTNKVYFFTHSVFPDRETQFALHYSQRNDMWQRHVGKQSTNGSWRNLVLTSMLPNRLPVFKWHHNHRSYKKCKKTLEVFFFTFCIMWLTEESWGTPPSYFAFTFQPHTSGSN